MFLCLKSYILDFSGNILFYCNYKHTNLHRLLKISNAYWPLLPLTTTCLYKKKKKDNWAAKFNIYQLFYSTDILLSVSKMTFVGYVSSWCLNPCKLQPSVTKIAYCAPSLSFFLDHMNSLVIQLVSRSHTDIPQQYHRTMTKGKK